VKKKKTVYQYLISLLSKRDYSRHRLIQKCLEKEYSKDDTLESIELLAEQRLFHEHCYTDARVRGLTRKNYGPEYIIQKLKNEDNIEVSRSEIHEILEEANLNNKTFLIQYINKRFNPEQIASSNLHLKLIPTMMKRGFSFQEIIDAHSEIQEN